MTDARDVVSREHLLEAPADGRPRPLVTVVVAAFDGQAFIEETLRSILAQTYRPFEIVVCDDGSRDSTPQLLSEYEGRITSFRQTNRGVSAARNAAVARGRGELIAFLDQDDLWEPELLDTQVDLLCRHPEWDLVYADSHVIDAQGVVRGRRRRYLRYRSGDVYDDLLLGNFVPLETTVMRRRTFEAVGGFDESLHYLEDYDFCLKAARRGPFGAHDGTLARYRIHGGNLSYDKAAMLREWVVLLGRELERASLRPDQRRRLERELARRRGELALAALRAFDLEESDAWMHAAGAGCPRRLAWKVRVPRAILGALPRGFARRLLDLVPGRRLYGVRPRR